MLECGERQIPEISLLVLYLVNLLYGVLLKEKILTSVSGNKYFIILFNYKKYIFNYVYILF